jgi:ferrous iron transport protein B
MRELIVAVAGQPNVGKTHLLNAISGARLKVGNFTGVTVEKAEALLQGEGVRIRLIDLPGVYTLDGYTKDEQIAKEFLLHEHYDLILNVLDSGNLERSLIFTAELMEIGKPMVLAFNMADEAQQEGISIDTARISERTGVPVLSVSAATGEGISALKERLFQAASQNSRPVEMPYLSTLQAGAIGKDEEFSYNLRYEYVRELLSGTFTQKAPPKKSFTQQADRLLIHPFTGPLIFLLFMWGLFQLTFTIGDIPMGWIESGFGLLAEGARSLIAHEGLSSLIADGIIAGVGTVLLFLPNILILFFGIALLETTGYMARVAFMLDGFLHRFGLHGKSFVPLITGFGCSVPAYMAARNLRSERDRLLTMFIIGFMSCGARLPVYVLFAGAFFGTQQAGNVLFVIYLAGAFLGLLAAKILSVTAFKGQEEPFVMEMPRYRLPAWQLIWHTVKAKAMMYIKKAATVILIISIGIWFVSSFPQSDSIEAHYDAAIEKAADEETIATLENERLQKQMEQSYLGRAGQLIEPVFEPMGFDWRMSVATLSGLAAKEVIVSTLGVLYSLGESDEGSSSLQAIIKDQIPLASAVAFIVFVMVYLPCLAATAVFSKEAGHWKYTAYLVLFTFSTAWVLAFVAYHVTRLFV